MQATAFKLASRVFELPIIETRIQTIRDYVYFERLNPRRASRKQTEGSTFQDFSLTSTRGSLVHIFSR